MNLDTQKRIAANLKVLRTCKDMSQSQIADMVGISRSLYAHYELGRRTPDAEVLYNISKRFGIDMAALFEADPQALVNQMGSSQFCDDDLMELVSFYKKLSPFAKGMLMERAMYLLDWNALGYEPPMLRFLKVRQEHPHKFPQVPNKPIPSRNEPRQHTTFSPPPLILFFLNKPINN